MDIDIDICARKLHIDMETHGFAEKNDIERYSMLFRYSVSIC